MTCGIYSITNTKNGKRYIGSAVDIADRWSGHRVALRKKAHPHRHLQRAWDKYGGGAFKFEIIARCERDELISLEQFYIDVYQAADGDHGYNLRKKADSNLGMKHSSETRAKISARARSAWSTPEARQRLSMQASGRKHRPESKAKVSAALRGRPVSAETRMKLSISNSGQQLTSEQHAKMLASLPSRRSIKLNEDDVRRIRELLASGMPQSKIAKMFGIAQSNVCLINTGKAWSHVK